MSTSKYHLRRTVPPGTRIAAARAYKASAPRAAPQSTEYSQSGGGDAGAASTRTAFDPASTAPETQERRAGAESGKVSFAGSLRMRSVC